jgi:RNA polymerase sigma-70 factor (ECF subfamily)
VTDPEVQAMLDFQAGNERAFDGLYLRHATVLGRFFHRAVGSRALSEELVQDTFFKIHRLRESYRPAASFRTYLFTVARSVLLNNWRRINQQRNTQTDLPPDLDAGPASLVEAELGSRQELRLLQQALAGLPERQRTALLLVRFEELSYEEAATIMKTSVPALKSILNRARTELLRQVQS